MKKHVCLTLIALMTVALTGTALAEETKEKKADKADFKLEVRKFSPTFNIKGKVGDAVWLDDSGPVDPTNLDFRRDLGIDNEKAAEYRFNAGGFRFTYGSFNGAGSKNLQQQIVFDGIAYTTESPLDTKMKINYGSFSFGAPAKTGNYCDALLDFKYFDITTNLKGKAHDSGPGEITEVQYNTKFVIPAFGLRFGREIGNKIDAYGEFAGLPFGKYGNYIDAEVGVKGEIAANTSLNLGYRYMNLSLEYEEDELKLSMKGPFVSLEHRF